MCGIVGYVGPRQAAPVLLDGLSKLEYRGYDSAGMAVRDADKVPSVVKAKGRLRVLSEKTDAGKAVPGNCGIGHTRWATHGEPSENNAHPHITDDMNVVAVHNGIIENYKELRDKMIRKGYKFYSETDTEVAVKVVDYYYHKYKMGPIDAIAKTMVRVRGSYALAVMFKEYPGEIYVARKDSPMIIGSGDGEITADGATFYNLDGDVVEKELHEIEWDAEAAEKGGFEHFMMKEIHEQPKAVQDTINAYIGADGKIDLGVSGITDEKIAAITDINIVACGSAYHVGIAAQYIFEDLVRVPVRVELASEFRYRKPILSPNTLVVVISQSGETADSLAALREAKELGVKTMSVVNVVGSSIARESDYVCYTMAGPEIAVATTKAYSTQLVMSYILAIKFGQVKGLVSDEKAGEMIRELQTLPAKIQRLLDDKERIQWFASKFANARDIFFIGRGIDYAISLEGSLKMKEISYIHSEAYAAGELKHGTISLIEDGTLLVGVLTQSALYEKTVSNMVECKSRGAYLMGLTSYGNYNIEDTADFTVYIPRTDEHFTPTLAVIPLQLMGYYVSCAKGLDVDKPRNLAKSVTVE